MRELGSKVILNVRVSLCAKNNFVWLRMDFQYAGDSTALQSGTDTISRSIHNQHVYSTLQSSLVSFFVLK